VLGTSAVAVRAAPLLLVDVETEQGVTGRSYVFRYRRSGARAIAAVLQEAAELVGGETVAPVAIATPSRAAVRLDRRHGHCAALSAPDMALWDALAVATPSRVGVNLRRRTRTGH
jgi:mandelate racemase